MLYPAAPGGKNELPLNPTVDESSESPSPKSKIEIIIANVTRTICTKPLCNLEYTVEFQWLEYLWNLENMFETGVVGVNGCESKCKVRRHNRDIFLIFYNMKVCCVFSLELPHRGDSNEDTKYTIFNIKKEKHPKLS